MTAGIVDIADLVKSERLPAYYSRINWNIEGARSRHGFVDKNSPENNTGVTRQAFFRVDVTKDFDSRCQLVAIRNETNEHGLPFSTVKQGWNHIPMPHEDPLGWTVTNRVTSGSLKSGHNFYCNTNQAVGFFFTASYHFLKTKWREPIWLNRRTREYIGRKGNQRSRDLAWHIGYVPINESWSDQRKETHPEFTFKVSMRDRINKKKVVKDEAGLEAAAWMQKHTPAMYLFSDFDSPFESVGAEFAFLSAFSDWQHRVN